MRQQDHGTPTVYADAPHDAAVPATKTCELPEAASHSFGKVIDILVEYEHTHGHPDVSISISSNSPGAMAAYFVIGNSGPPGTTCDLPGLGAVEPPTLCHVISGKAIVCAADLPYTDAAGIRALIPLFVLAHEYDHVKRGSGQAFVTTPLRLVLSSSLDFKLSHIKEMTCTEPILDEKGIVPSMPR